METIDFAELMVPTSVVLSSTAIVYAASVRSAPSSAEELAKTEREALSSKDAAMFPVFGSAALLSLYMLYYFLGKEYLNLILSLYFSVISIVILAGIVDSLFPAFMKSVTAKKFFSITYFPFLLPAGSEPVIVTVGNVISLIVSSAFTAWYMMTKHWIANNLFGVAFSIQAIQTLSIGNIKIASILLAGLFVYDVFWVFGTDVMVTVAKSVDFPIKLLFPKNGFLIATEFGMLGLGDIVMPGILVAFLLRFDAHRGNYVTKFARTYFRVGMLGYFLGMLSTIIVMNVFKAAQPALLYLVPSTLGLTYLFAIVRGELKELFSYSEESPAGNSAAKCDDKNSQDKKED